MNPGSPVTLREPPPLETRALAEAALEEFEARRITARAHLATPSKPLLQSLARLPSRLKAVLDTQKRSRSKAFMRYTDGRGRYEVGAAVNHVLRARRAQRSALSVPALDAAPEQPFVLFGLHMQPESSIDVWAPFFSNQMWVVELLARSIPPTHKLLVKIHKSDIESFSSADFARMRALPGVEMVAPFADAREFIERASLLVAIQGTMGLEAALLGKPVIVLGRSPVRALPSVDTIGALPELPGLVRRKLLESPPDRDAIVRGFARYLAPFFRASDNHWNVEKTDAEIDGYVSMFDALQAYLSTRPETRGVVGG